MLAICLDNALSQNKVPGAVFHQKFKTKRNNNSDNNLDYYPSCRFSSKVQDKGYYPGYTDLEKRPSFLNSPLN